MNYNNRFIAIATLTSAVLYIVSIIGLQVYISADLKDMYTFAINMADNHVLMLLYGWPGFIATLLILPVVRHLAKPLIESSAGSLAFQVTLTGLLFILIAYLIHLALTYFFAPHFLDMNRASQDVFEHVIRTTIGLQDMFWLAGDILAFGGIATLLLLSFKSRPLPRPVMIAGVIAGILAAIGSLAFLPAYKHIQLLGLLFIGGFAVFTLWEITVGILMLRRTQEP